jgi:hypothetical protein
MSALVKPWIGSGIRALMEVAVVVLFSFLPAFLAASKSAFTSNEKESVFLSIFLSTVANGQLLVFTSAILGTVIWLALPFWQKERFVVLRSVLIFIVFVLVVFVTFVGGFDPKFQSTNPNLVHTSILTYLVTIFAYVVLLVINDPPEADLGRAFQSDAKMLEDKYNKEMQE